MPTPFDPDQSQAQDPLAFWQERYAQSHSRTRGKAGQLLQDLVAELPPGRVLELGCSTGDDSLWLAEQGWQVTAVDISSHAIQTATRLAQAAGLLAQIEFEACDLTQSIPKGEFELVCALYFQSPFDFPRAEILRQASAQIVSGGHLLVVTHASGPPWGEQHKKDFVFPTLASEWEDLGLSSEAWEVKEFKLHARLACGPQGQEAEVNDNLIFVRRR